ncbi:hypothetical protein [Luteitalea sp. TBR-22]|uniref:hypothetical protein n=1 Tax=Luteitalea sp. TBR-22 TaxID=2802971 RepID=UPI001EF44F59|nr:hypothetical protein [Luteitalea sp. TBR-22]
MPSAVVASPAIAAATPSVPSPDGGRGATLTARYHVRQMESVLERAVEHAADLMRRRLQAVTPDVLALAGAPRAQGFRIEGYGLFFSVEVPRLSESVNWALRVLSQDRDERVLASLQKLASAEQDPIVRADLERAMRTVQLQLAVVAPPPGSQTPAPRRASQAAADGPPSAAGANQAPAAEPTPDPSAVYEAEVKQALVDAMLDYAGSLPLGATEWVTVAARDAGYVAFPDAVSDMVTVTLSVRVADLAEFRAQRLTRDEARARVVIREF